MTDAPTGATAGAMLGLADVLRQITSTSDIDALAHDLYRELGASQLHHLTERLLHHAADRLARYAPDLVRAETDALLYQGLTDQVEDWLPDPSLLTLPGSDADSQARLDALVRRGRADLEQIARAATSASAPIAIDPDQTAVVATIRSLLDTGVTPTRERVRHEAHRIADDYTAATRALTPSQRLARTSAPAWIDADRVDAWLARMDSETAGSRIEADDRITWLRNAHDATVKADALKTVGRRWFDHHTPVADLDTEPLASDLTQPVQTGGLHLA